MLLKQIKLLSLSSKALKTLGLIALIFLFKNSITQNIIVNGSFEKTTNLNCSSGPILYVDNWNIIASPDYFNSLCNAQSVGVPNNKFGYCVPFSGNSYAGLGTIGYPYETKEYLYQNLINPLISNKSYFVSFFISKSDRTRMATKKIGAYFSSSIPIAPANTFVNAIPQVENKSGFLTDTVNWVEISGYFRAQGGEQYITIGNFNSNANTDTLFTGTSNPFFADAGTAYYYIDSVSLYDSLDYITNVLQIKNNISLSIFPNPTQDKINVMVSTKNKTDLTIKITDVMGREIKQLEYEEEIDITDLEKGIYFLSLYQSNHPLITKKVVKE